MRLPAVVRVRRVPRRRAVDLVSQVLHVDDGVFRNLDRGRIRARLKLGDDHGVLVDHVEPHVDVARQIHAGRQLRHDVQLVDTLITLEQVGDERVVKPL